MKSLEEQLKDYKKFNEAKNAFISGMVMGWADQLEKAGMMNDTKTLIRIIKDMKEFSEKLAKSAGVIISNDSNL
jgi:hypothetical protein